MEFFFDAHKPKKEKEPYGKLASQQKMRLAMAFLNPLRPVINEGWSQYSDGKKSKAFGQALKKAIQEGIEGAYPDQMLVPGNIMISMGTLPLPAIADVVRSPGTLEVLFTNDPHPMAKDSDELVLIVISPELGIGAKNDQVWYRKDGRIEVELPVQFEEGSFHAYLYCHNKKKSNYSKSYYLGFF
ncbi:DUF6266 family protein [Olivibacter sp. XZL3]|uniref:DUF6266 family protein n=1 Tax=Olivibacter sp. XZL3 TaxID=1735116 RepID=UPI001066FC1B|nr:DUF6266 family protein [Olivibacter sp. XZL3]